VYLRLPTDVFERIEAKAKRAGRPFHRIVVDELSLFPHLDREARFGKLVRDMEIVLARYGSRLTVTEVNEALMRAVDEALAASCKSSSIGCGRFAALRSKANGRPQRMRTNSLSVASVSWSAKSERQAARMVERVRRAVEKKGPPKAGRDGPWR